MVNESIKVYSDYLPTLVIKQDIRVDGTLGSRNGVHPLDFNIDGLKFNKDFDLGRMYSFTADIFSRCELVGSRLIGKCFPVSDMKEDTVFHIELRDSRPLVDASYYYFWWLVIDCSYEYTFDSIELKVIKEGDTIQLGFFNK